MNTSVRTWSLLQWIAAALLSLQAVVAAATAASVEIAFGEDRTWHGAIGQTISVREQKGPDWVVEHEGVLSKVRDDYIKVAGEVILIETIVGIKTSPGSPPGLSPGGAGLAGGAPSSGAPLAAQGAVDEEIAATIAAIPVVAGFPQSVNLDWTVIAVRPAGARGWLSSPAAAERKGIRELDAVQIRCSLDRGRRLLRLHIGDQSPIPLVAVVNGGVASEDLMNYGVSAPMEVEVNCRRRVVAQTKVKAPFAFRGAYGSNEWSISGLGERAMRGMCWNDLGPIVVRNVASDLEVLIVLDASRVVSARLAETNGELHLIAKSVGTLADVVVLDEASKTLAMETSARIKEFTETVVASTGTVRSAGQDDWKGYTLSAKEGYTRMAGCEHCSHRPSVVNRYSTEKVHCPGCQHEARCRGDKSQCPACHRGISRSHYVTKLEASRYQDARNAQLSNALALSGSGIIMELSPPAIPCLNHAPVAVKRMIRRWRARSTVVIDGRAGVCVSATLPGSESFQLDGTDQDGSGNQVLRLSVLGEEDVLASQANAHPRGPVDDLRDARPVGPVGPVGGLRDAGLSAAPRRPAAPQRPVVPGSEQWRRSLSSPAKAFDGLRLVFLNELDEVRVYVFDGRSNDLIPVEVHYAEWSAVRGF